MHWAYTPFCYKTDHKLPTFKIRMKNTLQLLPFLGMKVVTLFPNSLNYVDKGFFFFP